MPNVKFNHQLSLPLILLVATLLRLWGLANKPLWVDEIYTAFYSHGKPLSEIPTGILLSVDQYWALLNDPDTPWRAAQAVTIYSNHPPLFFMAMNGWLQVLGTSVGTLRLFAVVWGVAAVAGMYTLGRCLGGPWVGKLAAVLMAVSPYGIYLSQEARHYSLAVAIAVFALANWISLLQGERSAGRWLSWIGLNALGIYVHYFYGFSLIAQWLVTVGRLLWRDYRRPQLLPWLLAMAGTLLLYLPWLSTALTHFYREGGTNWLSQSTPIWQTVLLPWLQSLVAGVFMVILFPVEQVPLWVTIVSAMIMLVVFGMLLRQFLQGWAAEPQLDLWAPIVSYGLLVFGVMIAITYGLGKDLTLAPRYFFMLYPAATAILALALAHRRPWVVGVAIAAGLVSQFLISYDIALLKPYLPGQVGRRLGKEPTIVLVAPQQESYQARALSYVLAIPPTAGAKVAFTNPASPGSWQPSLANDDAIPAKDFTLWLVEPRRPATFPSTVIFPNQTCTPVGDRIKTEGTGQQKYHCRLATLSNSVRN
ncbi:MAG: hypothetical protein F6K31_21270 [Symploca sp. SIO2G7]|nr:hypothetical protein [Symploca sp. SIO2G7]